MRENPFATLVLQRNGSVDANHMPLLLTNGGEYGVLQGHAARAMKLAECAGQEALIIFMGAHSYVSPGWYASRQVTGQVVPTWNDAVLHAYGRLRVLEDAARLRGHLDALTNTHEAGRRPWQVSDAPSEYVGRMIGALIGVEIEITRVQAKFKLSQNRPPSDRAGVRRPRRRARPRCS
jgi:transcriptional regulator